MIKFSIMLLMIPLCLVSRCILFLLGWPLLDNDAIAKITKYNRSVLVFSHTSYADFYIFVLYMLAHPCHLNNVRTLVKPAPFKYANYLLRRLGAIPSAKLEDRNNGAVARIVNELKQKAKCIFLISPKGTILNSPWRSGYYNIARELNANLMVAGLDYEKKQVIISPEISYINEETTVRDFLYEELRKIVPLFPEREVVTIRDHNAEKRGIVDKDRLLFIIYAISWLFAAIIITQIPRLNPCPLRLCPNGY